MKTIKLLSIALALLSVSYTLVSAQGYPRVLCGESIRAEFTESWQTLYFVVALQPGDTIQVDATRFGDYLQFHGDDTEILAPSSNRVARYSITDGNASARSGVLGERGDYILKFYNTTAQGAFTFAVTCTRNDEPLNQTLPTPIPSTSAPADEPLLQSGSQPTVGFIGLAPIDFASVSLFPLIPDLPITAPIGAQETSVFGLSFTGNQGDVLEISAQRSAGNLDVGFVIFAQPNTLVFVAGPVSSSTFTTRVTLPQAGDYVIGLFRMGALPPGAQATAFQVTARINPPAA